jgi:hypothetical protein
MGEWGGKYAEKGRSFQFLVSYQKFKYDHRFSGIYPYCYSAESIYFLLTTLQILNVKTSANLCQSVKFGLLPKRKVKIMFSKRFDENKQLVIFRC